MAPANFDDLPLASAGGRVDDSLALLDLTKASSVVGKQIIVGSRVQTTDVDVLVSLDTVIETLVQRLSLLWSSEDRRNSSGNGRLLLNEGTELGLGDQLTLVGDRTNHSGHSHLLR